MKLNVGFFDRIFRIILGLGIISLAYTSTNPIWGFIGLIPLFTGIFGLCPLYSLFGFSTCPKKNDRSV